ncbi:MAG: hypothetical protein BGP17_15650 [Sphingomonas sp. 67-41]|nr:MAG: hypothetical protein BGP17_15650 [Sphingomonas sp. 67-41]|tara:strand:- start:42 stop:227 length:186 start_codon:yes stop_codon:yes gene_type:complete
MHGHVGSHLDQSIEEAIEHLVRFLSQFDDDPAPIGRITMKVDKATFCQAVDNALGVSLRRA